MYCYLLPVLCLGVLTACSNPTIRVLEYDGNTGLDADVVGLDVGDVAAKVHGCRVDFATVQMPPGSELRFDGDRCDLVVTPEGRRLAPLVD